MRLIDADAFDRVLCNHRFTAALNEAAEAGTAFEDRELYYSTQSFRDVMKYRPTIDAVPLDRLCEWLPNAVHSCPANPEGHNEKCEHMKCEECWKEAICNWMEGWNKHATDTE